MSTVRDVLIGGSGAVTAAASGAWAAALAGRGLHTVDELVALAAAAVATTLGGWFALTALALLLARVVSLSDRGRPAAAALAQATRAWGAPLLRRAAVAGAGAGLALGVSPTWAAVGEPPPPLIASTDEVPLDLRPGFVAQPVTHEGPAAPTAETYVVRPGDSLWSISATSIGPDATDAQIAAEWPRWHRTNQAVVGADPDLIHPGQELLAPEPKDTP